MHLIEPTMPTVFPEGISAYFEPPVFGGLPVVKKRFSMSITLTDCVVQFEIENEWIECQAHIPEQKTAMRFKIYCPADENMDASSKLKAIEEELGCLRVALNGKL